MYIDAHCHLDLCENIERSIKASRKKGVKIIVSNGVNPKNNIDVLRLSTKFIEVKAALGIYPNDGLELSDEEIERELDFIYKNRDNITAIGEIGLDLKDTSEINKQKQIFIRFINLAMKIDKPVIVHSRKAELECIEVLEMAKAKKVLMHCFLGKFNLVQRIVKNGWFLSIPSSVNYNEHFQNIVKKIDIDNLLCETDSPYLHPLRKKNNDPSNVIFGYKKIAELKDIGVKDAEYAIGKNYFKLFI